MRHTVQKASDWPLLADSVAWHAGSVGQVVALPESRIL